MPKPLMIQSEGGKVISRTINGKYAAPPTAIQRDQVGPNGEKVGTRTHDAEEIDAIATRACQKLYEGNFES